MPHSMVEILRHILDEAAYLQVQTSTVDKAGFLADETLKRAFVRSLEVIGEAVKQVPPDLRQSHPQVPWRAIAGMRDRLIHGYFGVDYGIVWDAVVNHVPLLAGEVRNILNQQNLPSD